jgi:hypothetical protein
MTAGAALGSIIAVIIATHKTAKYPNEPSSVAAPMSIPFICQTATTHDAAASPIVAISAALPTLVLAGLASNAFAGFRLMAKAEVKR